MIPVVGFGMFKQELVERGSTGSDVVEGSYHTRTAYQTVAFFISHIRQK